MHVNSKQQRTLAAIFTDPVKSTINWADIESLLLSLGASTKGRDGVSRRLFFIWCRYCRSPTAPSEGNRQRSREVGTYISDQCGGEAMKYKGYTGIVEFDEDAKIFHGEVIGLRDVITFQGQSVDELEKAMVDSVDFYLTWCAERDKQPEKPFSGKLLVRTSPELHSRAAVAAARIGLSLNKYIEKAIEDETRQILA